MQSGKHFGFVNRGYPEKGLSGALSCVGTLPFKRCCLMSHSNDARKISSASKEETTQHLLINSVFC